MECGGSLITWFFLILYLSFGIVRIAIFPLCILFRWCKGGLRCAVNSLGTKNGNEFISLSCSLFFVGCVEKFLCRSDLVAGLCCFLCCGLFFLAFLCRSALNFFFMRLFTMGLMAFWFSLYYAKIFLSLSSYPRCCCLVWVLIVLPYGFWVWATSKNFLF